MALRPQLHPPPHLDGLHATARLGSATMHLFDELRADGVVFDMWEHGLLFVALDEANAAAQLDAMRALAAYGYRLPERTSEGSDLAEREPLLSSRVASGFAVDEERHVDPRTFMDGLAAALRSRGVTFAERTTVTGFARRDGHVDAVRMSGGEIDADHVVLAAGAWSGRLARHLGVALPMQAGKGYSFSVGLRLGPNVRCTCSRRRSA